MEAEVFTVDEVAAYLRTEPAAVRDLLLSGQLAGFRVGREWRILGAALIDFLKRRMEEEQLSALMRALSDPKTWALNARKHPEFLSMIKKQEFPDNTFGSFLKRRLAALEAKERTTNVVDIRRKRDKH
jgi:excisionase family DNA binding protein